MPQQPLGDLQRVLRIVRDGIDIPNDNLVSLVHAKRKSANPPSIQSYKAGEYAGVQVLQQEVTGTLVVPTQPPLPDACLVFQHRTQLTRRKVAEIKDFELARDAHPGWSSVELIATRCVSALLKVSHRIRLLRLSVDLIDFKTL